MAAELTIVCDETTGRPAVGVLLTVAQAGHTTQTFTTGKSGMHMFTVVDGVTCKCTAERKTYKKTVNRTLDEDEKYTLYFKNIPPDEARGNVRVVATLTAN